MSSYEIASPIELTFNLEFLSNLVHTHYGSEFQVTDFDLKRMVSTGEQYVSVIFNLKVARQGGQGSKRKDNLFFIVKALPVNPQALKYIRQLYGFETEVTMYEKAIPAMLLPDSPINSLPKCIASLNEEQNAYIVLEDLTKQGYKMANRITGLDLKHAKLAISELAKFHALSYIKFRGEGEAILKNYPELDEMFWVAPERITDQHRLFINDLVGHIQQILLEEKKEHVICQVERSFEGVFERMHRQCTVPETFPAVINFGDCWTNNLMFQYDKQGKPDKVKFLDFQLSRVTSRCCDLSFLLYTSVNTYVLTSNLEELLRTYHRNFNSFVSSHDNGKGARLLRFRAHGLTWEHFEVEWIVYGHFGTTLALLYTPLMFAPADLKQKCNENMSAFANIWKCKVIRDKVVKLL